MSFDIQNGFFITGTDTGVGKTIVTAALTLACKSAGMKVSPMKPVQSGAIKGPQGVQSPDLDFVIDLLQLQLRLDMCPYMLEAPVSPHLAGEMASIYIEMPRILEAYASLKAHYPTTIVEGAGGILVPLNEKETMLDLMKALNLPVILTTRAGLGTLNHTLLSLECLRNAGLTVAGVVIVDTLDMEWSFMEQDNLISISTFGDVPVIGYIPYYQKIDDHAFARIFLGEHGQEILKRLARQ